MPIDLSKLGIKPAVKYYYNAESDSYFTAGVNDQIDPLATAISKEQYESGLSEQERVRAQAAAADVKEAVNPTPAAPALHIQGQPIAPPTTTAIAPAGGVELTQAPASIADGADPRTFGPADLSLRLKTLDDLIVSSAGLSQLQIDTARKYVMDIMICLRVNPEFDSILAAKDVHNVMVFVQKSISMAQADFVEKKEKATKRAQKIAATPKMNFDMALFDNIGNPGVKALPTGGKRANVTFDLSDFGSMNTDEVEEKGKK